MRSPASGAARARPRGTRGWRWSALRSPSPATTRTCRPGAVVITPLIGWSFIGTGLFAWWRRPENRFGALMTAVGFVWFLSRARRLRHPGRLHRSACSSAPLPYALLAAHAARVSRPAGWQTRWERFAGRARLLRHDRVQLGGCSSSTRGPRRLQRLPGEPAPDHATTVVVSARSSTCSQSLIGIFGVTAIVILLVRRWRARLAGHRGALAPVLSPACVTLVPARLSLLGDITGVPDGTAEDVHRHRSSSVGFASVPFAFLVGLLRSRLSRAAAVSELVARLGEAGRRQGLRDALADALGDPSLSLVYWVPEQRPLRGRRGPRRSSCPGAMAAPPARRSSARASRWRRSPRRVARRRARARSQPSAPPPALRSRTSGWRPSCAPGSRSCAPRARGSSRPADEERRRLERDLHDGAQQRLVALALNLRLAGREARQRPRRRRASCSTRPLAELGEATDELRELARGHPPGRAHRPRPRPALEALAGRAPVPVELAEPPAERLPAAGRGRRLLRRRRGAHQRRQLRQSATRAAVSVSRSNGQVEVEVARRRRRRRRPGERARGCAASPTASRRSTGGSRSSAPRGEGTTVRAEIPCA